MTNSFDHSQMLKLGLYNINEHISHIVKIPKWFINESESESSSHSIVSNSLHMDSGP